MARFNWLWAWLGRARAYRLDAIHARILTPQPTPLPPLSTPIEAKSPASPAILPQPPITTRFEQSHDYHPYGDKARKIDLVVLHCTEGLLPGAVAWLTAKDATPVSAHYLVSKAGDLVQMVAENDLAFHSGGTKEKPATWKGRVQINARSIGVELENRNDGRDPYPPAQLAVCLWLVIRTCRRFGLTAEQVIGHADVDPGRKTDPKNFSWDSFRSSLSQYLQA